MTQAQQECKCGRTPEGLRYGYTTGTCAAAAAKAAVAALCGLGFPDPVTVRLPRGRCLSLPLSDRRLDEGRASAAVIKDAGDDPDVTHGCLVRVAAAWLPPGSGLRFRAGEGVGTVRLPGLPLAPGEPAINPVPRRMMRQAVEEVLAPLGRSPDLELVVSIPGGEELARRTWNPRLGIVGGLSILGTTGIVVPYSCSAWIHSIQRGVDVARALGLRHVAAATGRGSEAAVRRLYGLPEQALIEMGDFAGGLLKYLRRHPVPRLTLAGGFGKLSKLAQGALDLHSGRSRLDPSKLASWARELGADAVVQDALLRAPSAQAALEIARRHNLALADRVALEALRVAREVVGRAVALEVVVVDREGRIVGRAADG